MPEDDLLAQYQENISQSFKDGEYELCLVFTDKALKLDKDNFNALCYKATCLEKLGSYKKSLKIINQCLQEHDDFFSLWVTRGDCYYGLEKWKEAFDSYFTALPLDADNGAIMDKCARSLFRLGEALLHSSIHKPHEPLTPDISDSHGVTVRHTDLEHAVQNTEPKFQLSALA